VFITCEAGAFAAEAGTEAGAEAVADIDADIEFMGSFERVSNSPSW
jgi:hypothetical protein